MALNIGLMLEWLGLLLGLTLKQHFLQNPAQLSSIKPKLDENFMSVGEW